MSDLRESKRPLKCTNFGWGSAPDRPAILMHFKHSAWFTFLWTTVYTRTGVICFCQFFYRTMHFSAKRGLAIACRLSVCLSVRPSVTLVDCDHIGWNSSEIITPLVNLGCSLSADPNIRGLLQGEHPEILAQNDPPLLIWASETFDRKSRPNGYR